MPLARAARRSHSATHTIAAASGASAPLDGDGGQAPRRPELADEREAVRRVQGGHADQGRREPPGHAGLGGVAVQHIDAAPAREGAELAHGEELTAGAAVGARLRGAVQRDAGRAQRRVDERLCRAGHLDAVPVGAEPQRELEDVLGHAAVGRLEGEEDAGHRGL